MKKFGIAIIVVAVMFCLSSCGNETSTTVNSGAMGQQTEGNYYLYKTRTDSEYLSFLEVFDNDKFEIVDISTTMSTYGKGESYMITYKKR